MSSLARSAAPLVDTRRSPLASPLLAATTVLLVTTYFATGGRTLWLDRAMNASFYRIFSPNVGAIVASMARIGSVPGTITIALLVALVLVARREWFSALGLGVVVPGVGSVVYGLKPLIGRPRPSVALVLERGTS